MHADDALGSLLRANYARQRTRSALRRAWLAPVLFSGLLLGSLALAGTTGFVPISVYWAVAGPIALVAVALYYRRRKALSGLDVNVWAEIGAAAGLFGGLFFLAGVGSFLPFIRFWWLVQPEVGWGVPVLGILTLPPLAGPILIGAGYLALAGIQRDLRMAALAVTMALAIFSVGLVILTIGSNAELGSIVFAPDGAGTSTLSSLGSIVVHRVAPTTAYAITLLAVGLFLRRWGRNPA